MTNAEKYKDKITKAAFAVVNGKPTDCLGTSCDDCLFSCHTTRSKWLKAEYKEPEVDWDTVEVDTPILVTNDGGHWRKRYFARYENDAVYAWGVGSTSWSADGYADVTHWEYAKLAEVEGE